MEHTSGWIRWRAQYFELLRTRLLLARRARNISLAQIFIGAVSCLMLWSFQQMANSVLAQSTPHPPVNRIGAIPRCIPGPASMRPSVSGSDTVMTPGCSTLLYLPDGPLSRQLMALVAEDAGLQMGVDVLPLPGATTVPGVTSWVNTTLFNATATCASAVGGCGDVVNWLSGQCIPCGFATDNRTLTQYTLAYPNSTQNAVFFLGSYFGNDTSFAVFYNVTATNFPYNQQSFAVNVQRALSAALLVAAAQSRAGPGSPRVTVDYDMSLKDFPKPPPRISGFSVFANSGAQWTFLPGALSFFVILTGLVQEKEDKLRVGMRQMGLIMSAYWAAWWTIGALFSAASSLVIILSGYAGGFDVFTNSNPVALFMLYCLSSQALIGLAVLVSSFIDTSKTAQQVGQSICLVSFLFIAIIGAGSGGLLALLYSTAIKPWVLYVRALMLFINPGLAYTIVMYDIVSRAGSIFDFQAQRIVSSIRARVCGCMCVYVCMYVCIGTASLHKAHGIVSGEG